jgi:hypothetical protein
MFTCRNSNSVKTKEKKSIDEKSKNDIKWTDIVFNSFPPFLIFPTFAVQSSFFDKI